MFAASSIMLEVYYILSALCQYKLYYVWSFIIVAVVLMCLVVSCLTIVFCYFRLNAENYQWQWCSFMAPCFSSVFVFIYCIYYYFTKIDVRGMVQSVYFFTYSGVLSVTLGLVCGFVGLFSTAFFVRSIYSNLKTD